MNKQERYEQRYIARYVIKYNIRTDGGDIIRYLEEKKKSGVLTSYIKGLIKADYEKGRNEK